MEPTIETIELTPHAGMIVGYVLPDGRNAGEVRPAIIVRIWPNDVVNLQVFTDADNDYPNSTDTLVWATSVHYDESKQPRTWHYLFGVAEVELPVSETPSEAA